MSAPNQHRQPALGPEQRHIGAAKRNLIEVRRWPPAPERGRRMYPVLSTVGVVTRAVRFVLIACLLAMLAAVLPVRPIYLNVALTAGMCAFHDATPS